MSSVTTEISEYVRNKGINISRMARETGIPYNCLHASLGMSDRERELRADEFIKVCKYLEIDPMNIPAQAANPSGETIGG